MEISGDNSLTITERLALSNAVTIRSLTFVAEVGDSDAFLDLLWLVSLNQ